MGKYDNRETGQIPTGMVVLAKDAKGREKLIDLAAFMAKFNEYGTLFAAALKADMQSETAERVMYGTIDHAGGATQTIVTLPANVIVTDVIVRCLEDWNGDGTLTIGDDDSNDSILEDTNIGQGLGDVSGIQRSLYGAYLWDAGNTCPLNKYYNGSVALKAYITIGTTNTGTFGVWVYYKELAAVG